MEREEIANVTGNTANGGSADAPGSCPESAAGATANGAAAPSGESDALSAEAASPNVDATLDAASAAAAAQKYSREQYLAKLREDFVPFESLLTDDSKWEFNPHACSVNSQNDDEPRAERAAPMSDDELRVWRSRMFSEGVETLHEAREAVRYYRLYRDDEARECEFEELCCKYGRKCATKRWKKREQKIDEILRLADGTPLWQALSGLYPGLEVRMSPNERAARIRTLLGAVERMMRFEMRRFEQSGSAVPPDSAAADSDAHLEAASFTQSPVNTWDPLRTICFAFEISQRKLSMLANEIIGISATQIADRIRAESLSVKMKPELKRAVLEFFANENRGTGVPPVSSSASQPSDNNPIASCMDSATEARANCTSGFQPAPIGEADRSRGETLLNDDTNRAVGTGSPQQKAAARDPLDGRLANSPENVTEKSEEIFAWFSKSRRAPRWHRSAWAYGYGFSSHSRLFRACLLCFGLTPHQLEIHLIDEILAESGTTGEADEDSRKDAKAQSMESEVSAKALEIELKTAS